MSSTIGTVIYALTSTWSSNQFCHLSHSCNANTRLELWHLGNQPTWKAFTNCDIPSNHLISIDFRSYNLPCTSPCACNAPTCSVTLPAPSLSTCGVINRQHRSMTQTQLPYTSTTHTPKMTLPVGQRAGHRSTCRPGLTQETLGRYLQRITSTPNSSSQTNNAPSANSSQTTLTEVQEPIQLHKPVALPTAAIAISEDARNQSTAVQPLLFELTGQTEQDPQRQ